MPRAHGHRRAGIRSPLPMKTERANQNLGRPGFAVSNLTRWLDRRHIVMCCGILLFAEIVAWGSVLYATRNEYYSPDFISFYAAGVLADSGHPALAYQHAALYAAERAVVPGSNGFFFYPPVFLLLCAVFAWFPPFVALLLFDAVIVGVYLLVARAIVGDRGWAISLPLLAFPPVMWNVITGQNGLLTAVLFGAATLVIDRRPVTGGLLFGAVCYKPQLGLLIPVALASGRRWRAFAAAASAVGVLCLASLLVFGWSTWQAFLDNATTARGVYDTGEVAFKGFLTPFAAVRLLGGSKALSYGTQAVATLVAVLFVGWTWRRPLPLPIRAAALAAATLMAFPTIFYYDLMLDGVAIAWLFGRDNRCRIRPYEKIGVAGLFVLLVYAMRLADWMPIVGMIAWTITAIVLVQALRARRAAG